ncbi:DNA-directed RNA polymerase subunit E'' [Candidatus Woesearchaeota archaeon]|nr:MAG: DNA-directed RNA polymerase subunit E' [archaeon GW2011_AR18]MBS3161341.1 DNA-directed RNA polymerase subunit E'' [Candidatus Woesearchaeota archaeon]HIH25372.1 DNA-directed RNA polymerase subunit E'' [Nanoarchaeota archaeon]
MVKKKACKKCKIFVKGNECPICKGTDFTTSWKGRIVVMDADKSEIAKKLDIKMKGEYVIKVR